MRFHELLEGASMMFHSKTQRELQEDLDFPRCLAKDEALDTPYMSNYSMRQFPDALGYNPDFEDNHSPISAKEFIARTTQWFPKEY